MDFHGFLGGQQSTVLFGQVDLDAFQDSAGEVLDRLLWGSSGLSPVDLENDRTIGHRKSIKIRDMDKIDKINAQNTFAFLKDQFMTSMLNLCSFLFILAS